MWARWQISRWISFVLLHFFSYYVLLLFSCFDFPSVGVLMYGVYYYGQHSNSHKLLSSCGVFFLSTLLTISFLVADSNALHTTRHCENDLPVSAADKMMFNRFSITVGTMCTIQLLVLATIDCWHVRSVGVRFALHQQISVNRWAIRLSCDVHLADVFVKQQQCRTSKWLWEIIVVMLQVIFIVIDRQLRQQRRF